ncbi:MAG: PACE efflux transporter [Paracoccaceae bacterium]
MRPLTRKIVYAISFESLGVAVATMGLLLMSNTSAATSASLATLAATVALGWSMAFNTVFEAWESRQATRGRSFTRRTVHAILFEAGLVLILVPLTAWWLGVTLWMAIAYEAGLIALFIGYTYAFTWAFDAIFGLPHAAR